jgi:hypothetical protein
MSAAYNTTTLANQMRHVAANAADTLQRKPPDTPQPRCRSSLTLPKLRKKQHNGWQTRWDNQPKQTKQLQQHMPRRPPVVVQMRGIRCSWIYHLVTAQQHTVLLDAYCGVLQTMQAATWARLISPSTTMVPVHAAKSAGTQPVQRGTNDATQLHATVKQHKCWSLATC